MKFACILFVIFFAFGVAVPAANNVVLNEILFSISNQSSSRRDMKLYEAVLENIYNKNQISQFSKKKSIDFLLSRLSYKESQSFDLLGEKIKISEEKKKKMPEYTFAEIENEAQIIANATLLIELKENQLKQSGRFDTWFELLKRKYQVKLKSSEMK